MNKIQRITANLPAGLLKEALSFTGKGITETLIEGLKLVKRHKAFELAAQLKKTKLDLSDINIEKSRERSHR